MLVEVRPTGGGIHSLKTSPSLSRKQVVLSNPSLLTLLVSNLLKDAAISDLIKSLFFIFSVSPCLRGDNSCLKNVWNMSIRKRLREKRPIKVLFMG